MDTPKIKNDSFHQPFLDSDRPHILMITNHGIHQWDVIPGLPDTGGQNVFVNQMTDAMTHLGFRVTIVNRGGYPHPKTGNIHSGLDYRDEHQRILYIEDSKKEFVRKEDMDEQIPELTDFLFDFLGGQSADISLIISHYWDAAKIGTLLNERIPKKLKHVWIPHSVGALKKRNMNPSTWADLRVDERIAEEKAFLPKLDGVGATSSAIRDSLKNDYGVETDLFLPPCVNANRYHPMDVEDDDPIWQFLADHSSLSPEQIRASKIVTEVSRTDDTKRKDVLIKAFAQATEGMDDTLLVTTIDDTREAIYNKLKALIHECGIADRVAVLGSVWDELPAIYAITDVYCTPSVMEGFGMSIQEAAATSVPAVSSDLVPFAVEYLLGQQVEQVTLDSSGHPLRKGEGAIVVKADDVPGFAQALHILLSDDSLRATMSKRALDITIPYFTWSKMTTDFLRKIAITIPNPAQ